MGVLLISTYELGHQPFSLATTAAALHERGIAASTLDLSVEPWDSAKVAAADAVAISVPMHTAMQLAPQVVARVRSVRPDVPVALFGLYAGVSAGIDQEITTIAGEYAEPLADWARDPTPAHLTMYRGPRRRHLPIRHTLPPLDAYAHLDTGNGNLVAGYVEASSGCRHRCRHCPIPAVYDGRIVVADQAAVLDDIDAQVAAGARHITFGDPDFLNAPVHSRAIIRQFSERHPDVTFDITVKVEHILAHAAIWEEFAAKGCLFVVSAFETMADDILQRLDKGHSAANAGRAVHLLRRSGIEIRPSWLPFTPWTELDDVVDIFQFIAAHDLIPNTDAVQLSIRLLIPEGSLVLEAPDVSEWLGDYDSALLSYRWQSQDPRVDELQERLAACAEASIDDPPERGFAAMWSVVSAVTGAALDEIAIPAGATHGRPRMTEAWFC